MAIIVGIAGAARNAAAALCDAGQVLAVCEQERVTRTRRAGLRDGQLPAEAVRAVLNIGHRQAAAVAAYAVAEAAIQPCDVPLERVDHHLAHATTSFLTSPFTDAAILVCDRNAVPELTVWRGSDNRVDRLDVPWSGAAFARLYSRAAAIFGFAPEGDEHRLEALARVADRPAEIPESLLRYCGDRLEIAPDFDRLLADLHASSGGVLAETARLAAGVQQLIGQRLLELVEDIHRRFGATHLCLGGGLFFNSYFNTLLAQSAVYERTFIPVNPGNAGVAVGAALDVASRQPLFNPRHSLSPFLGPGYEPREVKATLDNCKLSYDYVSLEGSIERAAASLARGKLIGWFQDRMEWGPRALGNRSILASPIAPFVLENLNVFLKQREPHRSYSVSICVEDLPRYFRGPAASQFMEFEYDVEQVEVLRTLLPLNATKLRVHTVPASAGAFHRLIKAFGALTGVPILVNTSFNGFNEPIVCTPRDAIRVFFGTGLDMAVLGNFVLQK